MTYIHLTTNELTIIAHSFVQKLKAYRVAQMITRCGRKRTQLLLAELTYINDKIAQGWTPDTIIGRAERPISCNLRTSLPDV